MEGSHAVGGVSGLYLQIIGGSRVWMFRYLFMRHRRKMGLGSYPAVTLTAAREAARAALALRDSGIDPLVDRANKREAGRLALAQRLEFNEAAEAFIREHETTWRNTLATYVAPKFGTVPVPDIDQAMVLRALTPIWKTKTETATRLRGRIEQVLDWATAPGHRTGPNPARWRGQLEHILADPNKVAPVKHHAAVPFAQLPGLYLRLAAIDGQSARALRFLILTAARSGEVRGMVWDEVDIDAALWTVPADRMKAGKDHRAALAAGGEVAQGAAAQ